MEYFINESVRRNLDFDYILDKIEVITPYGIDYKRKIRPFLQGEENILRDELDRVEKFIELIRENKAEFNHLTGLFNHIKDLRNTVLRCIQGGVLTVVELFELKSFIFLIKDIVQILNKLNWELPKDLRVELMPELEDLLDPERTGIKTFYIYDSYSEELKRIRENKRNIENEISLQKKKIIESIKKELGLNVMQGGELIIPKSETELISKIDKHPYLSYKSETYVNIRYSVKLTQDVYRLQMELDEIKKMEEEEEFNIRTGLSGEISSLSRKILRNMDVIGRLDFTIAKAYMAIDIKGVKPEITEKHIINIIDGRHLRVEEALKRNDRTFIPISIKLEEGVTCITGANMGGKSVSLKLIGLLTAMAQHGIFVPCIRMETGLNEFIYISTGDNQSMDMGLSTFGAEIKGLKDAIKNSCRRGLILIDELARGTNPEEGYAISKAIVNFLKDKNSISVITTHYDNVADTEGVVHLQVIGLSNIDYERLKKELEQGMLKDMDAVARYMDYRLKKITGSREVPRDAVNIARLMGLEEDIIKEAERILSCKGGNESEQQVKS